MWLKGKGKIRLGRVISVDKLFEICDEFKFLQIFLFQRLHGVFFPMRRDKISEGIRCSRDNCEPSFSSDFSSFLLDENIQ